MEKILETFNQVKINLPFIDALFIQNTLRTCAPRRERLMCLRKFFYPLILVSYCLIRSLSSTRIPIAPPFLAQ